MDSVPDSSSVMNPIKNDCENEKEMNCKSTPRQCGANDDGENVFTSMSNPNESGLAPRNGPRATILNSVSSNESGQSSKLSENNSECLKNSTSQQQVCRLSCSSTDPPETSSSSRADSSACDNGVDPGADTQACHRHKMCQDKAGIANNLPSTSGTIKSCDGSENSELKENRKRPSSLKLNRPNLEDDSSSDTGNEDYSLGSEDGCIYTYKGGEHLADLPSSFFSLDMGLPLDKHLPIPPNYQVPQQGAANARDRDSRASSPDMDFLEMDFDPEPSCEVDVGDESTPDADLEAASNMPEESEPVIRGTSPEYLAAARPTPIVVPVPPTVAVVEFNVPSTSRGITSGQGDMEPARSTHTSHVYYGPYITHINARGEQFVVRRTMSSWPHMAPVTLHVSSGDLVSPRDILPCSDDDVERPFLYTHQINQGERPTFDSTNLSSALYHMTMAKRLMVDKSKSDNENHDAPKMLQAGDAPRSTSMLTVSAGSSSSSILTVSAGPSSSAMTVSAGPSTSAMVPVSGGPSTSSVLTVAAGPSTSSMVPVSAGPGPSIRPGPSTSRTPLAGCIEPPRCMVWSEREACERQVTQIGTSACGATAVVNVFIALGVPVNIDRINSAVGTRQRANNAPIARYILSRAIAGCTAADLVNGIQRASDGLVTARFFPTYPERAFSLSHWLADWIALGAVPILTLNLQAGCEGDMPDAWHHQMVFGVSSRGVYLCNPVECVRESALWPRLISPSVLMVKSKDIVNRFTTHTDLSPLMVVPDRRFHTFNVFGQVANILREWREHGTRTQYIRLPVSYQAGITIAALTGSEAHRRLMHAAQLPILAPQTDP